MRLIFSAVRALVLLGAVSAAMLVGGSGNPFGVTAAHAAVVNRIDVRGNTRVEPATVRAYVTIQPGVSYGARDVDDSTRALFSTGLFRDVSIYRSGSVLVVEVKENPVINAIAFEGNKKLKDEVLVTVIESKAGSVLTQSRVQADVQKILATYSRTGRFRARVTPKIITLKRDRVNLVFEIREGNKTSVSRVTFIGNKTFSDAKLREVVTTRESGILGWMRTTDIYDPDRLKADSELLRRYYFNRGFADFRIVSAVADLDRERNVFFITFTLEEGDRYRFGEIDVQTSLPDVDPEALRKAVLTKTGNRYNAELVEKSIEGIVLEVSDLGYAFAEVRPRGSRNYDDLTISVTYFVEEGTRAYVERIDIIGNTKTRDYVIRREIPFVEGDAFNRTLIVQAERNLNNLGFFKTARITTSRGSAPDRVLLAVNVEDQPTGSFSVGGGYSTYDGVVIDVSVTEKNFMGRGHFVRISVGGADSRRNYEFSFTNPRLNGRKISGGFDIYRKDFEQSETRSYDERLTGGALRTGFKITENLGLGLRYDLFNTEISNVLPSAPQSIKDQAGDTLTSKLSYTLTYSTLDNFRAPRDGLFVKLTQGYAGLGGDVDYLRTFVDGRYYKEIWPSEGLVAMLRLGGGYVFGTNSNPLRTTDHFFMGSNFVRGFKQAGIGPRDAVGGDALGGRKMAVGTIELTAPLPFIPQDVGLSYALFVDAGTVYDPDPLTTVGIPVVGDGGSIRAAAGFGIGWDSPMGPIRMDFAWPLAKEDSDLTEVFRFSGGTRF